MSRDYKKNSVTDEMIDKILSASSCKEASEITGVTNSWCWVLRKRGGKQECKKVRYSSQDTQILLRMHHDSIPRKHIASALRRTESSVNNKIKNLKIKGYL